MQNLFTMFESGLRSYPIQIVAIMIFIPMLSILIFNYISLKKNPMSRQIDMILNKNKNKSFVDKVVESANGYLGEKGDKIQLKLERSNIMFKKNEYVAIMVGGLVAGFAIGFIMFPLAPVFKAPFVWMDAPIIELFFARLLAGVVCAVGGYFLPELWIQYLMMQREKKLTEQMEDAFLIFADALRSGTNIYDAMKIVGREMKYPMGDEFTRAYEEIVAGKTFIKALDDLKARVDLKDFTMAINAIQIQSETGASLVPLLKEMVSIIGERKILKKQIDKAIAESKATGMVLMIAPILLGVFVTGMNREAFDAMLHSGLGIGMIIIGSVSYLLGSGLIIFIIRDISKLTK